MLAALSYLDHHRLLRRAHVQGQEDVADEPPGEAEALKVQPTVDRLDGEGDGRRAPPAVVIRVEEGDAAGEEDDGEERGGPAADAREHGAVEEGGLPVP